MRYHHILEESLANYVAVELLEFLVQLLDQGQPHPQ